MEKRKGKRENEGWTKGKGEIWIGIVRTINCFNPDMSCETSPAANLIFCLCLLLTMEAIEFWDFPPVSLWKECVSEANVGGGAANEWLATEFWTFPYRSSKVCVWCCVRGFWTYVCPVTCWLFPWIPGEVDWRGSRTAATLFTTFPLLVALKRGWNRRREKLLLAKKVQTEFQYSLPYFVSVFPGGSCMDSCCCLLS